MALWFLLAIFIHFFYIYRSDSAGAPAAAWLSMNPTLNLLDLRFWFSGSWNASCNIMTVSSYYPQAKVNLPRVAHSSPPLKKILKSFLSFHGVFFCLSLSDSPITQTVPLLSSGCLGVKFIPFTIDSTGGPFVLAGLRDALKLSAEKEAYAVSLNCFLWGSSWVNQAMKLLFRQQTLSFDIFFLTNNFTMMALIVAATPLNVKKCLSLIKHGYPKNHNDSMSINRIVLWASFFNLNLFKWVVWQGRVTKLLHLSESGPVCRCIQRKQTKQKCRADGESQGKDQIIRQLREKRLQVVSTVLTAPFIRQKGPFSFFFFSNHHHRFYLSYAQPRTVVLAIVFFGYGYLKITNVLFRYLETTSFAVSITRLINLLSQCLSEIRNTMSAYIHGVLTTVATNVSWKCQINERALIINASEYLSLT